MFVVEVMFVHSWGDCGCLCDVVTVVVVNVVVMIHDVAVAVVLFVGKMSVVVVKHNSTTVVPRP